MYNNICSCKSLGMLSAQWKQIPLCRQHDKGESFSCKISCHGTSIDLTKNSNVIFLLPDSSKPFRRSLSYFPDLGTKHDAHDNIVCWVHNPSSINFRHDHCKWKYWAKWTAAKIFIIKNFDPTLQMTKLGCWTILLAQTLFLIKFLASV